VVRGLLLDRGLGLLDLLPQLLGLRGPGRDLRLPLLDLHCELQPAEDERHERVLDALHAALPERLARHRVQLELHVRVRVLHEVHAASDERLLLHELSGALRLVLGGDAVVLLLVLKQRRDAHEQLLQLVH
jgi:hypothetical protein